MWNFKEVGHPATLISTLYNKLDLIINFHNYMDFVLFAHALKKDEDFLS
jgi:hypothetical protein